MVHDSGSNASNLGIGEKIILSMITHWRVILCSAIFGITLLLMPVVMAIGPISIVIPEIVLTPFDTFEIIAFLTLTPGIFMFALLTVLPMVPYYEPIGNDQDKKEAKQ